MHGVIDRAHAQSKLQTTQIAAIYCACMRMARSATQWLITVQLTSWPNVSEQLTLLPVRAHRRRK